MNRAVHGLFGVLLAPVLIAIALSGVVLAWQPLTAPSPFGGALSDLLKQIAAMPDVNEIDRLERGPDGAVRLHHYQGGTLVKQRLNALGQLTVEKTGIVESTAQTLHRELFAGRPGRLLVGAIAGVMTLLCITGLRLILRRAGGWRGLFRPAQGGGGQVAGAGRLHALAGQFCVLPVAMLALTGLWMSLESFGVIQSDLPRLRGLPDSSKVAEIPAAESLAVFDRPVSDMRSLAFPFAGDWFDVFVLQTASERLIIDQGTGAVLETRPLPLAYRISRWIYRLHTGAGLRIWAGVLGLAALAIPVFAATGGVIWARRRGSRSVSAREITIFVGSENGSTWDFARALAEAMGKAGLGVGLADLNRLRGESGRVQTALILTSTYGDGVGPHNGNRAVAEIPQIRGRLRYAVLGFGDRQFPDYCAYADAVDRALHRSAHERLMPLQKINQQSRQVFCDWVADLGKTLNLTLPDPQIKRAQKPLGMVLHASETFCDAKGTTAVLRFHPPRRLRFQPGDLIEVLPKGDGAPRAYSIASAPGASCLDLVVREHESGLVSPWLTRLSPGDRIDILHKRSSFRKPATGPVVMMATGTGIAPFISMIAATRKQNLSLYWGLRHDCQAFPFREQLHQWQESGHLNFHPAFSVCNEQRRVPDLLRAHHVWLRASIEAGATTMICGSQHAARDIRAALSEILSGSGITLESLTRQKRHLEDVY